VTIRAALFDTDGTIYELGIDWLGAPPAEAAVIGDAPLDLLAAKAAGIRSVALVRRVS
jgi:beta-phosphoglucomutase-like phosphatase (HAD superfamily)